MLKYFLFIALVIFGQASFAKETLTKEFDSGIKNITKSIKDKFSDKDTSSLHLSFPDQKLVDEKTKLADEGNAEAQSWLGYAYLYGEHGLQIDYKKALQYYELAAQQNSADALNNVASLYFNGIGTKANPNKAIKYFEKATQLGSNDAALNLAIIYLNDENFVQDDLDRQERILKLVTQSAKDNDAAKFLLGYIYYKGFGVNKDENKAFELIRDSANAKYDEAQILLAKFYINGVGTPKSYGKAVHYLGKAIEQGSPVALEMMGDIYAQGKIQKADLLEAYYLYNVASVMGLSSAAEKRDRAEKFLSLQDILAAQEKSEEYHYAPSDITSFIRQTFGTSLQVYIDRNMK